MKKIIFEIFANKFGNVLAIMNLALIAINASGLTAWLGLNAWIRFSFLVNIPARAASIMLLGDQLIPYGSGPAGLSRFAIGTLIFVYLQWIGIGWIARRLSQAIQFKLR